MIDIFIYLFLLGAVWSWIVSCVVKMTFVFILVSMILNEQVMDIATNIFRP